MNAEIQERQSPFAWIGKSFRFLIRHWKFSLPTLLGLIGLAIWLIFFYFAFHLLFIDDKVNEDVFVFASGAVVDMSDDEEAAAVTEPPAPAPSQAPAADANSGGNSGTPATATTAPTRSTTRPTTTTQSAIQQSASAEFMSRAHRTTGQAFLLTDGEQTILRIEDLRTDNGPDLDVYLVPFSGDAPSSRYNDDFINLGDLKGNIGDQFYEIPPNTDLSRYSTVVIWCVRFDVAFGTVELNQLPAS